MVDLRFELPLTDGASITDYVLCPECSIMRAGIGGGWQPCATQSLVNDICVCGLCIGARFVFRSEAINWVAQHQTDIDVYRFERYAERITILRSRVDNGRSYYGNPY